MQPLRTRLREYFVTRCAPPTSVGGMDETHEQESRVVFPMEFDVLALLDACPDLASDLMTVNTMATLDMIKSELAEMLRETNQTGWKTVQPDCLSLRPTHVPYTVVDNASLNAVAGTLFVAQGTIVRLCSRRVVAATAKCRCGKCGQTTVVASNCFHRTEVLKPRCTQKTCKGELLQILSQVWMDYAECRLQQKAESSGKLPRGILVALDDELSSKCGVGQIVEVVGIVRERWKHVYPGALPAVEYALWAMNITPLDTLRQAAFCRGMKRDRRVVSLNASARPLHFAPDAFAATFSPRNDDNAALRTALVSSSCPQLSGVFAPRLGLLLAAVGGTEMPSSTHHLRSTIHMLLVGDPSTGKSQLLRFAALIAPRSTCATGVTTTTAGLTVAATKEFGEWALEPGALVLSDGGTCCIDELRTVSAQDRTALHEAMEQQTISVAKAGLVMRLRTECSVVAACNPPMNRRNPYGNISVEIGVGGPLLSRFDLLFLLWDDIGGVMDGVVANHILDCSSTPPSPPLTSEDLALYIAHVRRSPGKSVTGSPKLSDEAATIISNYYTALRGRGPSPALCDAVPVTVRLLESLIRITQAHARLLMHSVCTRTDAAMALFLVERSAHGLKTPLPMLLPAIRRVVPSLPTDVNVFSSSRLFDDLFFDSNAEALQLQTEVLLALADVFAAPSQQGADEPLGGDEVALLASSVVPSPVESRKRPRSPSPQQRSQRAWITQLSLSPQDPDDGVRSLEVPRTICTYDSVSTISKPNRCTNAAQHHDELQLADDGITLSLSSSPMLTVPEPRTIEKGSSTRSADEVLKLLRFRSPLQR